MQQSASLTHAYFAPPQLQAHTLDRQYWLQQAVASFALVQEATPVWPHVPPEPLLVPPLVPWLEEPPELLPPEVEPPLVEPPPVEPPPEEPPLVELLVELPPVEPLDPAWGRQ
jgi:hypothetical protein